MTPLSTWAARWRLPPAALIELAVVYDVPAPAAAPAAPRSEAAVQAAVRVAASQQGMRLWRNNLGAYQDPDTRAWVRYGLANDSKQMNAVIKSSDLIGCRPRVIQAGDVGSLFGQFVAYEIKHGGWRYTGTDREAAQRRYLDLITTLGGEAAFVTSEEQV